MSNSIFHLNQNPMNWNRTTQFFLFLFLFSLQAGLLAQTHTVSGTVQWSSEPVQGVPNVDIEVSGDVNLTVNTDANGQYSFEVPTGSTVLIRPMKSDQIAQRVTIADMMSIRLWILNELSFDEWYQLPAGDVSQSMGLTTLDLVKINKVLIGDPTGNFQPAWHFFDSDLDFSMPLWPSESLTQVELNLIDSDVEGVNFNALKIGDVNGIFDVSTIDPPLTWYVEDIPTPAAGVEFEIPFLAGAFDAFSGGQVGLRFDPQVMEFIDIELNSGMGLTSSGVGTFQADQGELRLLWSIANFEGLDLANGQHGFTIKFKSLQEGLMLSDLLSIDPSIMPREAYKAPIVGPFDVVLNFGEIPVSTSEAPATGSIFLQNRPNPFTGATQLSFTLPSSTQVGIRVYDLSGRLVLHQSGQFSEGNHEHRLEWNGPAGIYLCELRTASGIQTIKMVKQ